MSERLMKFMFQLPVPKAHVKTTHKPSSVKSGVVAASIFVAAGLLFLLMTERMYALFPYIASAFLLFAGILDVFRGIKTKEYENAETKLLANGIVYLVLGLVILYHRRGSEYIIGALWGVLGVVKGSEALNTALHQAYMKNPFGKELIRAAIELLLGILLLIDAAATLQHHVFLLGIELLLVGWRILQDVNLLRQQETSA